MIQANDTATGTLISRFDSLVTEIEAEERKSAEVIAPQPPVPDIEKIHQSMLASANALATHTQMRQLHSAMFKVHRKIHQRHQLALHHCRLLQSRIRGGGYSGQELVEIVREIQHLLVRIRRENELMIRDRAKIKAEHEAFIASLPPQFTDQ